MTSRRAGMTLFELLTVLLVLSVLATLALPRLARRAESAAQTVTEHTLAEVRHAINGQYTQDLFDELPGPLDPARAAYPQLAYLYVNPMTFSVAQIGDHQWTYNAQTKRGWSGPYLMSGGVYEENLDKNYGTSYGETGDPAPLDGWGNPIVLQQPVPSEIGSGYSRTDRRFARLVSAGPDGVINTPPTVLSLSPEQIGDDIVLFLSQP